MCRPPATPRARGRWIDLGAQVARRWETRNPSRVPRAIDRRAKERRAWIRRPVRSTPPAPEPPTAGQSRRGRRRRRARRRGVVTVPRRRPNCAASAMRLRERRHRDRPPRGRGGRRRDVNGGRDIARRHRGRCRRTAAAVAAVAERSAAQIRPALDGAGAVTGATSRGGNRRDPRRAPANLRRPTDASTTTPAEIQTIADALTPVAASTRARTGPRPPPRRPIPARAPSAHAAPPASTRSCRRRAARARTR